jgi:hypothetical protein
MLAELPFVSGDDIAAEYKPGANVSTKAALRTLGGKRLISGGIGQTLQGHGGRFGGAVHIYSALNIDAARLHRLGEDDAAVKVAKKASTIEALALSKGVAPRIAACLMCGVSLPDALAETMRGADGDGLRAITKRTQEERGRVGKQTGLNAPIYARIMKLHGALADLLIEGRDSLMAVPTADLAPSIPQSEGVIIALRWHSFGPGMTLLTTCPAVDLDGDACYPYEPPLPSDDARIEITGTLARGATMGRPRSIAISGSK